MVIPTNKNDSAKNEKVDRIYDWLLAIAFTIACIGFLLLECLLLSFTLSFNEPDHPFTSSTRKRIDPQQTSFISPTAKRQSHPMPTQTQTSKRQRAPLTNSKISLHVTAQIAKPPRNCSDEQNGLSRANRR